MKQKFPFAVGIELTGIRKDFSVAVDDEDNDALTEAASKLVSAKMAKRYPKYYSIGNYRDIHCIEFPSPTFSTLGEMKRFYDFTMAQFAHYHIAPHHPEVVCGGNHIHFELNDLEWIRKILRDSVRRPWIPWIFTQADDTDSCGNYDDEDLGVRMRKAKRYEKTKAANPDADVYTAPYNYGFYHMLATNKPFPPDAWHGITSSKDYAFSFDQYPSARSRRFKRHSQETALVLEIRCVEAPLNFDEMKDQLDFFIRYVHYVKARPMPKGRLHLWKKAELQEIRRKDCVKEFYALLHQLGLDPKRYEKYVRRNLYTRWTMKRKRV